MITILVAAAVAVGVFVFVKNNPKKTRAISDFTKDKAEQFKDKLADEAAKLRKK